MLRSLTAAVLIALCLDASQLCAQGTLTVPDLSRAVGGADQEAATAAADASARGDTARRVPKRPSWWSRNVSLLTADSAEAFWGHSDRKLLPASDFAIGSNSASATTELGAVLSGLWRVAVATTLATSQEEDAETDDAAQTKEEALSRFLAGGGALSVQATRPMIIASLGRFTKAALLFAPRAWVNVPRLAPSDNVENYGGELAGSVLAQRFTNENVPFLTAELRGGWVSGSKGFDESLGLSGSSNFWYMVPTLRLSFAERFAVSVSTFADTRGIASSHALRLAFAFLNKDEPEKSESGDGK